LIGRYLPCPPAGEHLQSDYCHSLPFASHESLEPGSGGRQPGPGQGYEQGKQAAGEQEQRGQGLLASVVGDDRVHGQLVWQ
jgi:hypothetical protein